MHLEPCALLITDHLARERASLLPGFSESTLGTFNAQLGRGEMVLIIELDKRQRQIYKKAGECRPSRVTSVSGRLSGFEPRPAQNFPPISMEGVCAAPGPRFRWYVLRRLWYSP